MDPSSSSPRGSSADAGFHCYGRRVFGYRSGVFIFSVMNAIGGTGQAITLPLFLSTFGHYAGAYFVLFFCATCFVIAFGTGALVLYCRGDIPKLEQQRQWHKYYIAAGLCDALNGLFVVFSSFLGRVSGPLGAILSNLLIPFTFAFSRWFGVGDKEYHPRQKLALVSIFIAVLLGLTPLIKRLTSGEARVHPQAWWWPLINIAGWIPAALMQVAQDKCQDMYKNAANEVLVLNNHAAAVAVVGDDAMERGQGQGGNKNQSKRISVMWFQFWESMYQYIFFILFFWVNLIPEFGFDSNIPDFFDSFGRNWQCLLAPGSVAPEYSTRCASCAPLAMVFVACYILSYISSTELTNYASANTASTMSCIAPIVSVFFWTTFPSVNEWAGGDPIETIDIACSVTALLPLVIGLYMWRRYEAAEKKQVDTSEAIHGIELCCLPNHQTLNDDGDFGERTHMGAHT
jgi:drug/metabolite transporter (DMT)-like permease